MTCGVLRDLRTSRKIRLLPVASRPWTTRLGGHAVEICHTLVGKLLQVVVEDSEHREVIRELVSECYGMDTGRKDSAVSHREA